jgi:hypothetical protein
MIYDAPCVDVGMAGIVFGRDKTFVPLSLQQKNKYGFSMECVLEIISFANNFTS